VSDSTLEQAVVSALAGNRRVGADEIAVQAIDGADIDVDTRDGTVTLTGLVEHPGSRDRAERVALAVAGVERVDNRLKVLVPVPLDELQSRISGGDGPARRAV
jgi:osmotically-inducible protein OsmY